MPEMPKILKTVTDAVSRATTSLPGQTARPNLPGASLKMPTNGGPPLQSRMASAGEEAMRGHSSVGPAPRSANPFAGKGSLNNPFSEASAMARQRAMPQQHQNVSHQQFQQMMSPPQARQPSASAQGAAMGAVQAGLSAAGNQLAQGNVLGAVTGGLTAAVVGGASGAAQGAAHSVAQTAANAAAPILGATGAHPGAAHLSPHQTHGMGTAFAPGMHHGFPGMDAPGGGYRPVMGGGGHPPHGPGGPGGPGGHGGGDPMDNMMARIEQQSLKQMAFQEFNGRLQSIVKMSESKAKQDRAVGEGVKSTGAQ